jgi:hypothetical protein
VGHPASAEHAFLVATIQILRRQKVNVRPCLRCGAGWLCTPHVAIEDACKVREVKARRLYFLLCREQCCITLKAAAGFCAPVLSDKAACRKQLFTRHTSQHSSKRSVFSTIIAVNLTIFAMQRLHAHINAPTSDTLSCHDSNMRCCCHCRIPKFIKKIHQKHEEKIN